MRDDDKIQRQVHYLWAPIYDTEDTSGKNNKWIYNRAPSGYKFFLVSCEVSVISINPATHNNGIFNIVDGHEYTHWDIAPGVECREILARCFFTVEQQNYTAQLHNWECKEYTLATRSTSGTYPFKIQVIVWYYLQKMSYLETLYYAVIQPKWNRYKKAFRKTLSRFEE